MNHKSITKLESFTFQSSASAQILASKNQKVSCVNETHPVFCVRRLQTEAHFEKAVEPIAQSYQPRVAPDIASNSQPHRMRKAIMYNPVYLNQELESPTFHGSSSAKILEQFSAKRTLRLKDIVLRATVHSAVEHHKKYHSNNNPHWDRKFAIIDDNRSPIRNFSLIDPGISDRVVPPICLEPKGYKWCYEDGRTRHLRLLFLNNLNPEAEVIEGLHYTILNPEGKEERLIKFKRHTASHRYYVNVYNKSITEIHPGDFRRRDLPCIEYKRCLFKFEGGTRSAALIIIQKCFSSFSSQGLLDSIQHKRDQFGDFLAGIAAIFNVVARIGHTSNTMSDAYDSFKQSYVKPLLSSSPAAMLQVYGVRIVRLLTSVYRVFECKKNTLLTYLPLVLDIYELLKDQSFKPESLDTLLLAGVSTLLPKKIVDVVKIMSSLTSRKLFDDQGILLDFLSTVSLLMETIISYLPAAIQDYANKIMAVFGLSEYVCLSQSRLLTEKHKNNKHVMLDTTFRTAIKELDTKISALDLKRFFARSKPLSDTYLDFSRLVKGVRSYEETSRQEPCCFVFEGPPGCRKSVTVNKLINVLGLTHYAHIVKSAEDGKDWYDSYNSEEIFYMDDVGQMGKSQWRNLINWVSAVKLPLDCAESSLKDTKYFNSDTIILTTNRFMNLNGFTTKDCIDNPSALWRRGYVFDFSEVRGVGDVMEGMATFRHFDIRANEFRKGFPQDFVDFVNLSNVSIEDTCRVEDQNELLTWLSTIVHGFRNLKATQKTNNTLEALDVQNIRRRNPFHPQGFTSLDWSKDLFLSYLDYVIGVAKDMVGDFINIMQSVPARAACGVSVVVVLLTLFYKFKVHYFGEGGFLTKVGEGSSITDNFAKLDLLGSHNLLTKITSQMFEIDLIYKVDNEFRVASCYSLMSGRRLLVPYHLVLDRELQVTVYRDRKANYMVVDHSPVELVYSSIPDDVAVLTLSVGYPTPFSKLSTPFSGELDAPIGLAFPNYVIKLEGIVSNKITGPIVYPIGELKHLVHTPVVYDALHFPGMCGVLLVTKQGSIIGMHVAGSGDNNCGVALQWSSSCRDKLANIFNMPDMGLKINVGLSNKVYPESSGIKIQTNLSVYVPKNSNFIKSPLYNLFETTRSPANLSIYGAHTVKDIAKVSRSPIGPVDNEALAFAASLLELYFDNFDDLTELQIVKGDELLAGINKKSSNGIFEIKMKEDCFDFVKGEFTPSFRKLYDDFEERMRTGDVNVSDIAWSETLKDELRNDEKLVPRSFRICPVTMQVLTKKCFGNMVKKIVSDRWSNEIMIGINPFTEWPRLYNVLSTGKAWAGDIGKYDKNMRVQVQIMVARVILSFYKGAHQTEAHNILTNIAYSVVVVNDDTWILTHSLPSGCWLTAIFNSLVNRVYTAMWYYTEMKSNGFNPRPHDFHRDIADPVYGDDRGNTCKNPKHEPYLNAITMERFFNSLGMTMTDSLKKTIVAPFQPIEDITFLKRYFRYHPLLGQITCPLDLRTVYSTLSWIDSSKENLDLVLQDKINAFQREIFLHYDLWDSHIFKLEKYCIRSNISFSRLSEKYLISLYHSGGFDDQYASAYGLLSPHLIAEDKKQPSTSCNLITRCSNAGNCVAEALEQLYLGSTVISSTLRVKTNNFTTIEPVYDKYKTSLRTKEVIDIPSIYNKKPKVTHVPPTYKMNFDQILDKPFLVTTINWSTSGANFTELWRLPFPSAIMSNPLAKVPFNSATFYQAQMCCMLQVSGTPMHQGLLLVAAVPHGTPAITNPNQILSAPHVFLNATESTSVCLECPMYTPSTLYRTLDPSSAVNNLNMSSSSLGTDVFDLVFLIMDALTVATGASTSISISVHNIFKTADFYVPKVGQLSWQAQCGAPSCFKAKTSATVKTDCVCGDPIEVQSEGFVDTLWRMPTRILDGVASGLKMVAGDLIDYGRSVVKTLTGFHNPNLPSIDTRVMTTFRNFQNNVDQPIHLEVLDNHALFSRIYDDYYFRTSQDEMDLKFLTSKPVYVGKFSILSSDVAGKNLFAYPMTPMVENSVSSSTASGTYYSPLRTIYECSRYWRGGLKLHIQAVCTNFHFAKIIVLKNYAMTDGTQSTSATQVPQYNNIHNINTDTMEFSAGGQIQTIDLPYCSNLRQLECTKDYKYNAISHGMAYGYLVQPLTYNSNVPTSITFNVYISGGDDLEFSGYATDPISVSNGTAPTYPGVPSFFQDGSGTYEIVDKTHTGRILDSDQVRKAKLEKRKTQFKSDKPEEYVVQEGDDWNDIAFITSTSLETIRDLNAATHNAKSKLYSMTKGPLLMKGEKLKYMRRPEQAEVSTALTFVAEGKDEPEGNNALVSPNTQDPLLNHEEEGDENIKMSFRPNTSIRDYMRFMYPQQTISITPTSIQNVYAFDLNSMINAGVDGFHALHSLYLGQSGGVKLKFKISGASVASAMYAPPGTYVINGDYPQLYPMSNKVPTDPASLADFISQSGYVASNKSFTSPQIEMQDYTRPYNATMGYLNARPGNTFVLEMAIPNMNPFNYAFNANKWFSVSGTPADPENDMGVVYVCFEASYDGTNYAPVTIIPFIGLNDEARMGFQVYCPAKTIPTYTGTVPASTSRRSIFHPTALGSVEPPGIPMNPVPFIGSCYYFNTT